VEKRNSFLTFLTALIPGVGYMYLGLIKKGVQALALFFIIKEIFPMIGIGFLDNIILVPFWFYTFFDTFNIAGKINRGEQVSDSEFIFEKYNWNTFNNNAPSRDRRFFLLLAWTLIVLGILAILNRILDGNSFYYLVLSSINAYFFPALLIVAGLYLLMKESKINKG